VTDQIRSQVLGLSLAVVTAVGCLAYERLVKAYSYFTVGLFVSLSYLPFWLLSLCWTNTVKEDVRTLSANPGWIIIFLLSGLTGPLWYSITRKQSMLVGAGYEVKYIVILAIGYLLFGKTTPSWYTLIGVCFALLSVYFISK